ncbi:MAG: carbohydrate binding domain-containing protein [Planctomycetota bacterium]|jgi:hypothetical protein
MMNKQLKTSKSMIRKLLFITIMLLVCSSAVAQDFVPFVIPARPNPDSLIAYPSSQPIKTDSKHIDAYSGYFYGEKGPVRLWGANLSFGANMPKKEDAPHIAARLAAAGVNAIRCHHMDTARWPRGLWNAKDGKTIEPEALDRLDYFIDQLARRGIYVNINLHVGRAHSQYLDLPKTNRQYDKMSNIFTPALIDAQKKFARELLTHVNKYRKVRYADDPAVAIVEITNENSLFMWGSEQTLRTLPPYYADILQSKFNAWLQKRYGLDRKLRNIWSEGAEELGKNMLDNSNLKTIEAATSIPQNWNLEQHSGCKASLSRTRYKGKDAQRIDISKADDTEWHLQFNQGGLAVKSGKYFTVTFNAAADKPRRIGCGVSQAHSPWNNLGLSRQVELKNEWQSFRYGFVTKANDDNARISFSFGGSDIPIYLANIEFRPGGRVGLEKSESIKAGTVAVFAESESPARILDRMQFLAETEKAYFDGMRNFIKNDLGCKAMVTGTIVFGPLGLYAQSDMDFIDAHAYWQHPRFPGRPWDSGNWLIDQKPMTDYPAQATLSRLAAERLHRKPFTVSEYNHPAPLDSQAECVPMIASFAAAQNWDGIWLYTYSHSSDGWYRENINSYFDIDTNPAKWGFMRAGAAIFRDICINQVNGYLYLPLAGRKTTLQSIAALHTEIDRDMARVHNFDWRQRLNCQFVSDVTGRDGHIDVIGPSAQLRWLQEDGKGLYIAEGRRASAYTGHAELFKNATNGRISISEPKFLALTITSLESESWEALENSEKILITACGRCENTGMKFSEDRRTVGRNWGQPPVRIEPVEGTLVLPKGQWTCKALGPDGLPKHKVAVSYKNGRGILQMAPKYQTMWYLLRRQTKPD